MKDCLKLTSSKIRQPARKNCLIGMYMITTVCFTHTFKGPTSRAAVSLALELLEIFLG